MATIRPRLLFKSCSFTRSFSTSLRRQEIRDIKCLPHKIIPEYQKTSRSELLALRWPAPPRNILLVKKNGVPEVTQSVIDFAKHIHSTYPSISVIVEADAAAEIHDVLPFPVHTLPRSGNFHANLFHEKVDLVTTLGGDGTILHASSLFATTNVVPPLLSFSLGTLGFLGEWKFQEYKRAFREVYMSGAGDGYGITLENGDDSLDNTGGWSSLRGKSLGATRNARILMRNRLKVGVYSPTGKRIGGDDVNAPSSGDIHAMNEVILHRGKDPHLVIVEVFVGGRFLTEAVADGMIVATPTGSTAYSLSSGGSIVHPLVSSLLITPICPRSLSFRPLVLPSNTPVTLRLSEKNRGREVEVSVDGVQLTQGLNVGMEIKVWGEEMRTAERVWKGGVPSVMRGASGTEADDGWVGGLNGLLKFNYPFGEET